MNKTKFIIARWVCFFSYVVQFFLIKYVNICALVSPAVLCAILLLIQIIEVTLFEYGIHGFIESYRNIVLDLDEKVVTNVYKTSAVFAIVLSTVISLLFSQVSIGVIGTLICIVVIVLVLSWHLKSVLDLANKQVEEYRLKE